MNKKMHNKVLPRVLVALLAVTLLFGIIAAPQAEATDYKASYINKMDVNPQLDLSPYLDSDVMYQLPESVKDDDEISVIVTMSIENLMDAYEKTDKSMSFSDYALKSDDAKKIQEEIAEKQADVLAKLDELAIAYTVGDNYSVLLTGFEIAIRAGDFKAVNKSLDKTMDTIVCEVYMAADAQLVENKVNVFDTGIIDSTNVGYDGTGMVVAVLDTGLDYAHSAFSVENFHSTKLGMTKADVAALLNNTFASQQYEGLTVDDVYYNEKVPFGFDYADKDPDVYSTHNSHGTHVSGIILGNDDTIRGVAPNAQLVSMKVFSDIYDSAKASWILSALEDCVVLGVDAINMSLGTSCGFSRVTDEAAVSDIYDRIRDTGISLIVAASNDYSSAMGSEKNGNLPLTSNPDSGTVGSPGTYPAALSVASINGVKTPYIKHGETIIYFNESNTNAGKENNFFDNLLGDQNAKEIEFVVIPGVGRTADYTGLDVKGKIALVRRGDNTFEEKALIAQSQGAAGIIIYNNVAGDIKMNSGDAKLAMCSINQDDGERLAATGGGVLSISKDQKSGPFMSDFSSWGPTPSLDIKPEITQHGGNILSAITGGDYDRLSGTSMACPNLCGLSVLLRQYVVENFADIANDPVEVNHMVYRLMMSTADIIINKNGLPYAVRKQGAGLANLEDAIASKSVLLTYDEDGKVMNKTKLELGDDKNKTGIYEMTFAIQNFGTGSLSYDIGAYVLTEGVSETLTAHGLTTVTETAYSLDGAVLEVMNVQNGTVNGKNVTVSAGQTAKVTVKITLSDADKKYLDDSFENGMYVEGFITLTATAGTEVDMSIPYLAFYGDWTVAPQQDLDYFQTDADAKNDALAKQDKVMPDAYATTPIGGLYDDYINYLGSYYFLQNPSDIVISAKKEFISLTNVETGINSLRYIWTGMLRNAAKVKVTITDDATGEVIYEVEDVDVRKSHGGGGSYLYPANVEVEFNIAEYNLKNNAEYTVRMETYLDYKDDGKDTNERNVFEFPFVVDFQAPAVQDVQFYYEYDKTLKKNRLYADVYVYDNQHAMALMLGYVDSFIDENGQETMRMNGFQQYMTPIYSVRNGTTVVKLELTDYINELRGCYSNNNEIAFCITTYDYAMNTSTFEIGMPYNFVDFFVDGLTDNTLTMSPNELYNLMPSVYPNTEWGELLIIESMHPNVADVVNNKIIAKKTGEAVIKLIDPANPANWKSFKVKVLAEGDEGYKKYDKPAVDQFTMTGYETIKAYYMVSSDDREIGDIGDIRYFNGNYYLSMYPSESVRLNYELYTYFPKDCYIEFTAGNSNIVTVDQYGVITAVAEGYSSVTAKVYMDGKATFYTQTITIAVKDPYAITGGWLNNYYGLGGIVDIPARFGISTINSFAFSNYKWEMKTEEELAYDDQSKTIRRPIGDNTITKVIIPEGVETINEYAFAKLTALETVVFPSTLRHIDQYAFYGCTNLKNIEFSGENNLKIINQYAFAECDLQGDLELSAAYVISDYAFAGNEDMTGISLPKTLMTIGNYAFAGCEKLSNVQITADKVKFGSYAFMGCSSLTSFYVNSSLIPAGMFYRCENLAEVTIGRDVNAIQEFAFNDTKVSTFTVETGNTAFAIQSADYVISADGTQLIAVAPTVKGRFAASNIGDAQVTSIGRGAFSHNMKLTAVYLPTVTDVGAYAFGFYDESRAGVRSALAQVTLGELTNIGEYAFYGLLIKELPNFTSSTTVGKYAFANTSLTSVTIPNGMVVSEGMFASCNKLVSVNIGDDVVIGDYAFVTDRNANFKVRTWKEGKKTYAEYVFSSSIENVTIGKNATIGKGAFQHGASIATVTLGEGANIGEMAFYNCVALKNIDLSKAVAIGDYAFSGDTFYVCADQSMQTPAISAEGRYMFTFCSPALTNVDLSMVETLGAYAFAFCQNLTNVTLGEKVTAINDYTFYSCEKLANINLENVATIGNYAFTETAMPTVTLNSATNIGNYAFANITELTKLTLNADGSVVGEASFAYCSELTKVENLQFVTEIGAYAYAYTGLVEADLSAAVKIGDQAFMKSELAPLTVKLGENLVELGDNPFAYCKMEPFSKIDTVTFNGVDYSTVVYDYQVSDTVYVINGNLYCVVANGGFELITYTGLNADDVQIADGTVRITAYAFAGTQVKMATLPYTVKSIGHKAFFDCNDLQVVVFKSFEAPVLEEEYDPNYFNSYENLPGSGEGYLEYTDFDGNLVVIKPLGILSYFMWNYYDNPSCVYYGANFINNIGHIDQKIMMVRPSNGQHYGTFIHDQYFNLYVAGDVAAQDATLAAIAAINQIPERVELVHRAIVEAARAAYAKVPTLDQQALVSNYGVLVKAEQRIKALLAMQKSCECGDEACGCAVGSGCVCGETCVETCPCMQETVTPPAPVNGWMIVAIVALCLVAGAGIAIAILVVRMKKSDEVVEEIPAAEEAAPQVEEEAQSETETATDAE